MVDKGKPGKAKPSRKQRANEPSVSRRDMLLARYYAPDDFNAPKTLEALLAHNEIELFDLKTDPDEVRNLGVDTKTNKDLILRMNDLLNRMIAKEVGVNDGGFLKKVLSTY